MQAANSVSTSSVATGQPAQGRRLSVQFTGSGSEYFRIWIVNLLLTIITLSLYRPFARARRLTYFQNNTVIDGASLGFHGDPWKMLKGYLIILLMVTLYTFSYSYPKLLIVVLLGFTFGGPALWRAALQFRLGNTSWRGVRFQFQGSLEDAYKVSLPVLLPFVLFGVSLVYFADQYQQMPAAAAMLLMGKLFAALGLLMLAVVLALPWLLVRIKRYQHGGYAYAQERAQLRISGAKFYLFALGAIAWSIGIVIVGMAVVFVLGIMGLMNPITTALVASLGYLCALAIVQSYMVTRLQNILWSNTRSYHIEFRSHLKLFSFFRLTLVNWLLIACTLGLFWPFAQVRVARARLEALEVGLHGESDGWVSQAQAQSRGALGDAGGDFFGMDIGL